MRKLLVSLVAVLALVVGCSEPATNDRTSGKGKDADITTDAWNVTLYRNADNIPNIALFCIHREDPIAVMSTLSGGDTGINKTANIVPLPKLDASYCGGRVG